MVGPAPRAAVVALVVACSAAAAAGVSPAGDAVPANLLRIELDLDEPPAVPQGPLRARLMRGDAEVDSALLDLPLPSRDGRKLTLLLHPGRIKTGVGPNLRVGPALQAGTVVTLIVDEPALRKTWRVEAAARNPLVITDWPLSLPGAGTRAALSLQPAAVLNGSAAELVAVADAAGRRVPGRAVLSSDGARWQFRPAHPWRAGRYTLRVHPALEDAAGNRQCAPFEAPALSAVDCSAEGRRPFVIARRGR